jgi:2-polyprenyl-3-methyl-5-hydroxy-6-metoxy-1,4-benzoquinol methylase
VIVDWLKRLPAGRLLDLGCSGGLLSARARALGHHVVGVDVRELPAVHERVDRFICADLDRGLPDEVAQEGPFDIVVAGDVLEHVREPGLLLGQAAGVLAPRGALIVSVPNFGHWYVRARALLGIFDYDQRGLLDRTHVRFFTRRSIERELRDAGLKTVRKHVTGLPLDVLAEGRPRPGKRTIGVLDRAAVALFPTLFGYQLLYQCETSPAPLLIDSSAGAS